MPDPIYLETFRRKLIGWFVENKRPLPWRADPHWYNIFLSEYLFQQTQIAQGLPYYHKFIKRFPDIFSLAAADEQEVLALWAGLGYYARARNLLRAARLIVSVFNGALPEDYQRILSLPGIGPYAASALTSILFNQPRAVIDGNVLRVLTRVFAIANDIRLNSSQKQIEQMADRLIDVDQPGLYNEALMELGALVCKPQKPVCSACPLNKFCLARKNDEIQRYPFKSRPSPKRKLRHYVFLIMAERNVLLVKRPAKGLLASMWEFPTIEVDKLNKTRKNLEELAGEKFRIWGKITRSAPLMTHNYSHIRLNYAPLFMQAEKQNFLLNGYVDFTWLTPERLNYYPIHNAHKKIIRHFNP